MKIIIANATINTGNKGCAALCMTSLYLFDRILSEKNISYEFYLTDSGSRYKQQEQIVVIGGRTIKYKVLKYPYSAKWPEFLKILLKPRDLKESICVFRSADYILDIGQGDSFADIYGKSRFLWIDRVHQVARFFGKKYALLPQTIGPFTNATIEKKAMKSIANAAMVMVRDKMSYDYVVQKVPTQKNVHEYIDVAFFLPYKKKEFSRNYIHVGLNISALLWNGGYTGNNQFGLKCDYQKTIRSIIDYFLSLPNVMLHLVPHVVEQERNVENDYAVSFDLCEEYNHDRMVLAPFFLSPVDAKSYIAGLDFFMGARMHATIAAFSSGVPVVPMAYSRKFNGLFEETLDYHYIVDLKQASNENALETIISVFGTRAHQKEAIQLLHDDVIRQKRKQLYQDIANFLQL